MEGDLSPISIKDDILPLVTATASVSNVFDTKQPPTRRVVSSRSEVYTAMKSHDSAHGPSANASVIDPLVVPNDPIKVVRNGMAVTTSG